MSRDIRRQVRKSPPQQAPEGRSTQLFVLRAPARYFARTITRSTATRSESNPSRQRAVIMERRPSRSESREMVCTRLLIRGDPLCPSARRLAPRTSCQYCTSFPSPLNSLWARTRRPNAWEGQRSSRASKTRSRSTTARHLEHDRQSARLVVPPSVSVSLRRIVNALCVRAVFAMRFSPAILIPFILDQFPAATAPTLYPRLNPARSSSPSSVSSSPSTRTSSRPRSCRTSFAPSTCNSRSTLGHTDRLRYRQQSHSFVSHSRISNNDRRSFGPRRSK